ncbi:hypothetical protein N0V93_010167 [Gnomoniopsis smithogilvyi]|uniref:Peptidase M43 pregnancy-associated plasma-A domain-containing protein n=1 Tax=Gnomoniopsis smithogilvyi TaxID=1191159 RepID=A0A9W9CT52_9PEZI|nr:hypothetical protein N0V93_010167 [Gnomoniopsis smithogilvyi]
MYKKTFLLLGALVASCAAAAARSCGAPEPTEAQIALAKSFYAMEQEARLAGNYSAAAQTIEINVYFHVLSTSNAVEDGYISEDTIAQQLDTMNAAFAPSGISFVQAGLDYTINTAWASDQDELEMKQALRKGTYADLNLYFEPIFDYLGYCYFPDETDGSSDEVFLLDGCTIYSFSVPGGSATNYDLGLTAVHEIGHHLGLYHTFQGGCVVGDRVDDTPAEASAASGCPEGRDTCAASGVDPIHNYMDYTYDTCYEEFTQGQTDRMYTMWNTYRAQFK